MKKFFYILCIFMMSSSLALAYEGKSKYIHNTSSYIHDGAISIAKQLKNNAIFNNIKNKTIIVYPLTKKLDENLMYAMKIQGFKIIDEVSLKRLGVKNISSEAILISTFTRYKYNTVINSRIIDTKSGLVLSVAQIKIPKKVIQEIQRLHHKNSWFKK